MDWGGRGFDFLGYHFGPEGLAIAQKTLNNFVERTIRLYEQGASSERLWEYVKRWHRWSSAGVAHLCVQHVSAYDAPFSSV